MKKRGEGGNLYTRWRPRTFAEFIGNGDVLRSIRNQLVRPDPPRSWLLYGPSGTGKTTTARVIGASVVCVGTGQERPCGECSACGQLFADVWQDYREINCADNRGIDFMRMLIRDMRFSPVGKAKIYVLDECHKCTNEAANALLKAYEDGIGNNYIVLCTTEPQDVLETLKTRAVSYGFKNWSFDEAMKASEEVFLGEGVKVSAETTRAFVTRAYDLGITSPRALLNAMDKVITAKSLGVLDGGLSEESKEVIMVCRAVFAGDWSAVMRAWSTEMDADAVRLSVAGYLRKVLMKETDIERGLAIAEALKEVAVRVDDHKVENGILARLFIATARMSLVERR